MTELDPVRLCDDPSAPNHLRRDLSVAARAGVVTFDIAAAQARFEAARANVPVTCAKHAPPRTARWWGVGAVGLATLVALAAWGARALHAQRDAAQVPAFSDTSARSGPATTHETRPAVPTPNPASNPGAGTSRESPGAHTHRADPAPAIPSLGAREAASGPTAARDPGDAPGAGDFGSRVARRVQPVNQGDGDDLLARDSRTLTDTYAVLEHDPSRALALANAGAREFPNSPRLEQREAIAVQALVALHRASEARARGERFLSRWPSGVYAGAVRQALYANVRDH